MKDISPVIAQNEFVFLKQVIVSIANTVYYKELLKSIDSASLENLEKMIKAEENRK
jgi:hypothetical protein